MKILNLTLKKKWFDMVSDPNPETRKDEEYRELKNFWFKRLFGKYVLDPETGYQSSPKIVHAVISHNKDLMPNPLEFDAVCFKHGYAKDAPTITRECKGIEIGTAKPEWSDNWQGDVFKIKLGEILS